MVKDTVDSWNILWNPKYKGNILMFDSVRDTMGIALKKLGYSINSTDPNQIRLVNAKMEVIKKMMASGQFFIYDYLDEIEKAKLK